MKKVLLLLVLGGLALAGCGKKEAKPTASSTNENYSSGNPVTAPVDYLGALAKAKKNSEKTIDTVALNQAVQQFNVTDRKSTRLNSSHSQISYAVFCLKKK